MNWFLVGGSILASLYSIEGYLSFPGEMIRYGLGYFVGFAALFIMIPIINRLFIPIIMGLPIASVYEYLERRFDQNVRSMGAIVFVTKTLLWLGIIIYTAGFAFTEMSGWSLITSILMVGVFTTIYTSVGGFRTVVWTDNLQLWILLCGACSIPMIVGVLTESGPLTWWQVFSDGGQTSIQFFSFDPTVRITVLGSGLMILSWYICASGSDQMTVQRYLSTSSVTAARRSVWVFVLCNLFLVLSLMLVGLALYAFYFSNAGLPIQEFHTQIAQSQGDRLLPLFIARELPLGMSGLLVAALMAAAMSSLSSGINSISSVLLTDFLDRFGLRSSTGTLFWERTVALAVGAMAIITALAIGALMERTNWSLVELASRVYHLFFGPLAVLFFAGILFRHVGSVSVKLGFALSTAVSLFIAFGETWFHFERSISFMWQIPTSFTVGLLFTGLIGFLTPPPSEEKTRGLTIHRSFGRRNDD